MSGFLTGVLGTVAEILEPGAVRAERVEARNGYELVKMAGVALVAIAAVGVLYALLNGLFFTSLLYTALCVVAVDVVKIGSNGVALSENYASMIDRVSSAAGRRGIMSSTEELVSEALFHETLVLGACLRPLHEQMLSGR